MVWVWIGVFAVAAIASAAQALSGFGFALIATPAVAVLAGPHEAIVGLTMVGLLLVAQLSLRGRGHVDRPTVLVMTVAAILGMPLGYFLACHGLSVIAFVTIAVFVNRQDAIDHWHGAHEDF